MLLTSPRALAPALLLPLLAACASAPSTGVATTPSSVRQPVRTPVATGVRDPQFHMEPGLEGIIGATERQIVGQFGPARLNVWEGDARKLQYAGDACVLDIYLYPTTKSREPLASFAEARRSSDGKDVDKAACVRALRR